MEFSGINQIDVESNGRLNYKCRKRGTSRAEKGLKKKPGGWSVEM